MTRRSSSLVTIILDNEVANELISRPDGGATMVIEFGNNEMIHADDNFGSSTERILQTCVEGNLQINPTIPQLEPNQSGTCNKVADWFKNCKIECNCLRCWNRISEFLNVRLEALNEKLNTRCKNSYLEVYFTYANVSGISPFRFGTENQRVVWLKKVPYYVVNTLAILDTVQTTKELILSMIEAHEDRSAEIMVYLKNSGTAAHILLRVGLFVSLKFYPEKFTNAVKAISVSAYRPYLYKVKRCIESLLVCGSSLFLVLVRTHLGLLYGIENYIVENAETASLLFSFSRPSDQVNVEGLNTMTIGLGLLGWAMNLAGTLVTQVARDGILFSALTLGKSTNAFRFKGKAHPSSLANETAIPSGAEILTEYRDMKNISKHINSAFNIVFRFFLLANIFMFAVFIDEWFDPGIEKVVKSLKLANVILVCITFYYSNQAAKTGDRFREWMKQEENRNKLGLSQMDVMMESSSISSIGFGRGALFIYDSTLIGFASVVAAYFFGIVETRPQLDVKCENLCPCKNSSSIIG